VLLSDIDGLYSSDPRANKNATLIKEVRGITDEIRALAGSEGSALGTGGMVTKLNAGKICNDNGCDMIIANGANPSVLYDIIDGKDSLYTRFFA
jgi:glutamate 5-kinase